MQKFFFVQKNSFYAENVLCRKISLMQKIFFVQKNSFYAEKFLDTENFLSA